MHLQSTSTAFYNTELSNLLILLIPDLGRKLQLTPGCCVVILHEGHKKEDSLSMDPSRIAMVCWRGKGTMNVMLSPPDRNDLLERMEYLFGFSGSK